MTANILIAKRQPRTARNNKDPQRKSQRQDIGQQFLDAGFKMINPSLFQFTAFGTAFYVRPSFEGLKVTSKQLSKPRAFVFGTAPDIIADWCLDTANRQDEDWLTENLPQTEPGPEQDQPPYCYGLNGSEAG